ARAFAEAASAAGTDYPEPEQLDGLDEYPAFSLLKRWMPILTRDHPELRDALRPGGDPRLIEKGFRLMVAGWTSGRLDTGELETFVHFRDRVQAALADITRAQGRGKRVAVFTSGGPISMAMQLALELDPAKALNTAWVVVNGSFSEFRYRESDALTLVRFNAIPHLRDRALITYR
ncbi:MAG: histidine phosphatase family protein, partial [Myxococcota bacterium]